MPVRLALRHRLLLRAAVGDQADAAAAWRQWRALSPVDGADQEEANVIPLLASRLGDLRAPLDAGRLRGVRRHALVRQFAIRGEMAAAATALREAGITPVAIKGLSLAGAYGSERTRAVGDADVLVPHEAGAAAVDALLHAGFELGLGLQREHLSVWAARYHAVPLRRPGQLEVDVHWRLSHQPQEAGALTSPIFRRATADGTDPWLVPHPAHQLGIAVAHGWPTTSAAALRMLVDLAVLLDGPHHDAALVDEVVGPHRLRAALADALAVLDEEGVPEAGRLSACLPPVRIADRIMAHVLLADREGLGARWCTAAAHRRLAMARPRPSAALRAAAPADPASGAAVSLCGSGWWIGDGWATWARQHLASLRVDASLGEGPGQGELRLGVAAPPGGPAWLRWAVVIGRRPRLVRLRPEHTTWVAVPPGRRATVVVISPRLAVPHRVLGNGDQRRLGVALTAIAPAVID